MIITILYCMTKFQAIHVMLYFKYNFSLFHNTNLNDFFNSNIIIGSDNNFTIKASSEDLKTAFNVDKKEDLLNQPLLQVIPQFVNGNHYNLLINKNIVQKFGY